mgnify:CR=1 FL=1
MFSAHLSDSGDGIVDPEVLDDRCQHHPSTASTAGAVNQGVPALGQVVDKVQDVVHEVTLCPRRIRRREKWL